MQELLIHISQAEDEGIPELLVHGTWPELYSFDLEAPGPLYQAGLPDVEKAAIMLGFLRRNPKLKRIVIEAPEVFPPGSVPANTLPFLTTLIIKPWRWLGVEYPLAEAISPEITRQLEHLTVKISPACVARLPQMDNIQSCCVEVPWEVLPRVMQSISSVRKLALAVSGASVCRLFHDSLIFIDSTNR